MPRVVEMRVLLVNIESAEWGQFARRRCPQRSSRRFPRTFFNFIERGSLELGSLIIEDYLGFMLLLFYAEGQRAVEELRCYFTSSRTAPTQRCISWREMACENETNPRDMTFEWNVKRADKTR